jgi:hypothetical protein
MRELLRQNPSSRALVIFADKALGARLFSLVCSCGGETSLRIEPRELALILEGIEPPKRKRQMKTISTMDNPLSA